MRKNKMMRLASCLLVAVLLTTSMISGTFAKYVSEATGTDSARVAKWSFTVSDKDITQDATFTFDLFNTVKDSDGTTTETNVANKLGDGKVVIAPGTSGSFQIDLKNNSEVDATYAVAFTADKKGVPLEFKVGDGEWKTSLDAVAATNIAMGASADVAVQWRWVYHVNEAGDTTDTGLGIADPLAEPSVTVTVTATQVD